MNTIPDIVIATQNPHKFSEIAYILADPHCRILPASDFPALPEIVEDGLTLRDNAILKAKTTALLVGKPCIADDTGFFIRALDGKPGIHAAVYAGQGCSYDDNVDKVLTQMFGMLDRYAYFSTVSVLYCPHKGLIAESEGKVAGYLTHKRQGDQGFGYDPIFIPAGFDLTYAQLSDSIKNKMSHRYLSIHGLKDKIADLIGYQCPKAPETITPSPVITGTINKSDNFAIGDIGPAGSHIFYDKGEFSDG
jgi:XTP/dITP diphosphohydrolase